MFKNLPTISPADAFFLTDEQKQTKNNLDEMNKDLREKFSFKPLQQQKPKKLKSLSAPEQLNFEFQN